MVGLEAVPLQKAGLGEGVCSQQIMPVSYNPFVLKHRQVGE